MRKSDMTEGVSYCYAERLYGDWPQDAQCVTVTDLNITGLKGGPHVRAAFPDGKSRVVPARYLRMAWTEYEDGAQALVDAQHLREEFVERMATELPELIGAHLAGEVRFFPGNIKPTVWVSARALNALLDVVEQAESTSDPQPQRTFENSALVEMFA